MSQKPAVDADEDSKTEHPKRVDRILSAVSLETVTAEGDGRSDAAVWTLEPEQNKQRLKPAGRACSRSKIG